VTSRTLREARALISGRRGGKTQLTFNEVGEKLVREYLAACGGEANGFFFAAREERLAVQIAETMAAAVRAAKGGR
jgi:hypothetical protein